MAEGESRAATLRTPWRAAEGGEHGHEVKIPSIRRYMRRRPGAASRCSAAVSRGAWAARRCQAR